MNVPFFGQVDVPATAVWMVIAIVLCLAGIRWLVGQIPTKVWIVAVVILVVVVIYMRMGGGA